MVSCGLSNDDEDEELVRVYQILIVFTAALLSFSKYLPISGRGATCKMSGFLSVHK